MQAKICDCICNVYFGIVYLFFYVFKQFLWGFFSVQGRKRNVTKKRKVMKKCQKKRSQRKQRRYVCLRQHHHSSNSLHRDCDTVTLFFGTGGEKGGRRRSCAKKTQENQGRGAGGQITEAQDQGGRGEESLAMV